MNWIDFDGLLKKKKKMIIKVSASWCQPCIKIGREIQKFFNYYHLKNCEFIELDYDEMEKEEEFQQFFQTTKVPTFYFIEDGKIKESFTTSDIQIWKKKVDTFATVETRMMDDF
jgi:thiol-disulfide isomerase/thioredoxin